MAREGKDSNYIRLTGLWKADSDKKYIAKGIVEADKFWDGIKELEAQDKPKIGFFLFKNDYCKKRTDPQYSVKVTGFDEQQRNGGRGYSRDDGPSRGYSGHRRSEREPGSDDGLGDAPDKSALDW